MLNPILEKDIKTKMRGWRMPIVISIYVLLLGLVLFLFFVSNNQMFNYYGYSTFNPRIAVNAYNTIAIFQFGLLMFIVPALTATAISGERERQTLDLMLCSDISTWSVIIGKLVVSIANIMLFVVASIPVLGMVFLFGGITFGEMMLLFLYYAITALMAASMGIFFSTLFRKNVTAIIATYLGLGIIGFGPVIAMIIWGVFGGRIYNIEPTYGLFASFMFPSPGFGFVSFISSSSSGGMAGIFSVFGEIQRYIQRETGWIRYFQPWMLNSMFNLVLSGFLIWLSAWKLKPVKKRRKKKGEAVE
jgi:ABC-2 type transport system permease protein